MEKVDARISKEWRRRMLFMLFMVSGIAAWFLYDGYVVWPAEAERHAEFVAIEAKLVESGKIEAVEHKAHGEELNHYLRIEWERHAIKQVTSGKSPKSVRMHRSVSSAPLVG